MLEHLRAPVRIEAPMLYGLDLPALTTAAQQARGTQEKQVAVKGIATLHTIQKYLTKKRAKIQESGDNSLVTLVRIAGRLLTIEKTRLETL